jgi:hypothetical protein
MELKKSFSIMIGVKSRQAAASLMKARRSSAGRFANSSIFRHPDLEHSITHPARHQCM